MGAVRATIGGGAQVTLVTFVVGRVCAGDAVPREGNGLRARSFASYRFRRLERRDDRAWFIRAMRAGLCQFGKGSAGVLQCSQLSVELGNPQCGQVARAFPVFGRIKGDQLADFLKRESRRLCRTNKAQAAHIIAAISPYAARSVGLSKQAASLVIAHCFDPHVAGCCQLSDRHHFQGLTPYYSTEPI